MKGHVICTCINVSDWELWYKSYQSICANFYVADTGRGSTIAVWFRQNFVLKT